jgi:hypothetical protein
MACLFPKTKAFPERAETVSTRPKGLLLGINRYLSNGPSILFLSS